VDERIGPLPEGGPYALYRLAKCGLGTPEAVEAINRKWRIRREQVAYGGLKDRHARTTQHLTILRGPRRGLSQTSLQLDYLGQVARPLSSKDILGNQFQIVLRDLMPDEAAQAGRALQAVQRDGLPNYFDQQRFGSVGQSGEFVARAWCAGDYERAVWLALADPNVHDRPNQRAAKAWLREHWGQWDVALERFRGFPDGDVVAHLAARPSDFRRAMARFRPDLRGLLLAAYQSYLWNALLAELLRQHCEPGHLIDVEVGGRTVPLPVDLEPAQRAALAAIELPLPCARVREEMEPWKDLMDRVLAPERLTLGQLRVKYPRDSFFSKGSRPAVFSVDRLEHQRGDDQRYPGRQRLTLRFELPRGCYATILTRRIGEEIRNPKRIPMTENRNS
jgi:tRNA pseudouridine13 synthase